MYEKQLFFFFTLAEWLSGMRAFHHSVPSLSLFHLPLQHAQWLPLIGRVYLWLLRRPLALVAWRGGSLTNKFYLPLLQCLWSLFMSAATLEFSMCVCACACAYVRKCAPTLPRGKKNIKLSNQGATDRAFGTTEEPNGCVGCAVAEPSWNGVQLSAGQANLCLHSIHRHTLTVYPCKSFGWFWRPLFNIKTGKKKCTEKSANESQFEMWWFGMGKSDVAQHKALKVYTKNQSKGGYDRK